MLKDLKKIRESFSVLAASSTVDKVLIYIWDEKLIVNQSINYFILLSSDEWD